MSQDITLENHISLIQIELQKNDFKRALDLCLVALDSFPSNPKLLINCGNIFKILGNSSLCSCPHYLTPGYPSLLSYTLMPAY